MIFKNNKTYEILKWLALVVFDAIGVAYQSLAGIWGLPYGDEVFKTCVVASVFLGALIGVSSNKYQEQELIDYEQLENEIDNPEEEE